MFLVLVRSTTWFASMIRCEIVRDIIGHRTLIAWPIQIPMCNSKSKQILVLQLIVKMNNVSTPGFPPILLISWPHQPVMAGWRLSNGRQLFTRDDGIPRGLPIPRSAARSTALRYVPNLLAHRLLVGCLLAGRPDKRHDSPRCCSTRISSSSSCTCAC